MSAALDLNLPAGHGRPVATGEPFLTVRDVGKQFGTFVALDRVSLTVASGEFVSFLGPSGCGKTTLLRAIAGLGPATSGRIVQAGRDITGLPPSERDFGIVFQSYALFPNMSVTENIGYGLRGAAWPKARRQARVAELLALVGLAEHAPKYPAQLSGGQQQRVALARALANEPGLLLLDEPLSALDAIVRLHLRQEIRALQQRLGVTTIMVTHDQEEALGVSDRIVVMSRGRIEQIGTPEEIYSRPASPFVARFVGRSSHFDAVVESPPGTIGTGGLVLPAEAARKMLYGGRVTAFIRPEDVQLGAAADFYPMSFEATVTGLEFLGPVCRLSMEGSGLRLEADAAPDVVRGLAAGPGATVRVALPPERIMVFPADD
jgi:iron(III) transport system ATP-binding protein